MSSCCRKVLFVGVALSLAMVCGCGPFTSTVVELNRERYVCKNDPDQFAVYRGKRILLSSIQDDSKNTKNLAYFNPEQTVGYKLLYTADSMPQPVVSFFWYALRKGFECVGVMIEEHGPIYESELSLIIDSLTDEEMKFRVLLIKPAGVVAYQGNHVVTMPKVPADNVSALEERAYRMLDAIVANILSEPGFKKAFL